LFCGTLHAVVELPEPPDEEEGIVVVAPELWDGVVDPPEAELPQAARAKAIMARAVRVASTVRFLMDLPFAPWAAGPSAGR